MNKIISACLLAGLAVPASAGGQEPPPIFSKLKPKVGSWGEYSFESRKGDKVKSKGKFRMAVVGKEGDSFWVEQTFTLELPKPKKDEAMGAMKLLMNKEGVQKAFMKSERGVMDMSSMMARKKPQPADDAKMTEVGEETISVPAGKFKAAHFIFEQKNNTGDAWMKPGVGPYGMIKQVHRDDKVVTTLELLASGGDAKSEIDEKTAQSMMGAMMGMPRKGKHREEASEDSTSKDEASEGKSEKPSVGGFLKNALKKKLGGE